MSQSATRGLVVTTRKLSSTPDLLALISDPSASLWRRRSNGMVGLGLTERLTFSGPDRIAEASRVWNEIAHRAQVEDEVALAGTGLIAFGTFAFDAKSDMDSVLVIPKIVIGHRGGSFWLTRISFADQGLGHFSDAEAEQILAEHLGEAVPSGSAIELLPGQQSPSGYSDSVVKAVERIHAGTVNKVVLSRDLRAEWNRTSPASALRSLAESYPDCWTFSVDGLFGASPETLISVTANTAEARVLAGTARRGLDAASDAEYAAELASSSKDSDEHGFAVRSVVDALAPHTTALTMSEEPFTLKLPNVWHLATDISAQLTHGSTALDLVDALHPTAAVAGNPTAAALDVISELEPFDRGRYAGPVGWINAQGDGEWAIALRCAQISGTTITAYAGGGIVADSVPEVELAETTMKFRPIVEALN